MKTSSPLLALIALLGLAACNVDNDGDGSFAQFDCDDNNATIYPGADEICDGLDNDCDGVTDNDTTDAPTFFRDFDGDGYGDPEATTTDCQFDEAIGAPDPDYTPFGYVANSDDCDDALGSVNPDADEICDGLDNDCDNDVDGDNAIDKATWYADADEDGFGDPAVTADACDAPAGFVGNPDDCDDDEETINPDADETCDDLDRNCDGDPYLGGVDAPNWYLDADGDGFGDALRVQVQCLAPDSYVADDTDCNDEIDRVFPGAVEVCDGFDTDCNPSTSEAGTVSLNFGGSFGSIQAAVNAASPGDLVNVCEGDWVEQVTLFQPVSLVAPSGPKVTSLTSNGEGSALVVALSSDSTDPYYVAGFRVHGGNDFVGGGMYAEFIDLELEDMVFENNEGYLGGGLYGQGLELSLVDVAFADNEAVFGGGFFVEESVVIGEGVIVNDNVSDIGGGVFLYFSEGLFEDSRFAANYAADVGGGAALEVSAFEGGTFASNLATNNAGGIGLFNSEVTGVTVSKNRAGRYGGGVGAFGTATIAESTIDDNDATWGAGIALGNRDQRVSTASVTDSDVTSNVAARTGGGLYVTADSVTLTECAVTGNEGQAGGGVHLVGGSLDVTDSDFGAAESEDDNTPDDVFADGSGTAYTFEDAVSFFCTTSGFCE
jgi:hypothetical protein